AALEQAAEVVISPPSLCLIPLKESLRKEIKVAAQNCYCGDDIAFTGEIRSPPTPQDAGILYVILGHSEGRMLFHETSELVAQKVKSALTSSLSVILCIGETGKTTSVCAEQLQAVVDFLGESDWRRVPIPSRSPRFLRLTEQTRSNIVSDMHADVRAFLAKAVSPAVAAAARIFYGGSVTARSWVPVRPDVHGFLVGGASLKLSCRHYTRDFFTHFDQGFCVV
ncbi:Triosephosphate isomerase, partial [Mycena galericulata]